MWRRVEDLPLPFFAAPPILKLGTFLPEPQRLSMNTRSLLGLLALATLAVTSCKKKDTGIVATHETEEKRSESIEAAFVKSEAGGSGTIAADRPEFRELDEFFAKLGKAARNSDRGVYFSSMSADAMVRYLETNGSVKFKRDSERKALTQGMERGLTNSMSNMAFDRHVLVRLEETAPGQVVAFTRTYDDRMEVVSKFRWWLVKENGAWKVYDFEDLDQGLRTSTLMGAAVAAIAGGSTPPWLDNFQKISAGMNDVDSENALEKLADLQKEAEAMLKDNPPAEIEAFARLMLVSGMLANEDFTGGLAELEKLEKLPNRSPMVHYQKGSALAALERPTEARAAFEAYAAELGWDRDVHEMMADSFLSEGKKKEALEHALKGLADDKNSTGCLATASVAAGAAEVPSLKKHFDANSDPEAAYDAAITYAIEMEDPEVGRAVLALLKEAKPDSELIEFHEGELTEDGGEMEEE